MTNLPTVAHARLGASKAERWMNCPGSIRLSRDMPDSKSSFAQEGTAAHSLAARALLKGLDADVWLDTEIEGVLVTDEMCDAVQVYLDHVRERRVELAALGGTTQDIMVEQRFDLSPLNPPGEMFGTADCVLVGGNGIFIECDDYKHGVGVVVDAEENEQLMYYCLGALVELRGRITVKPEGFRVTIVQPRAFHPDGIIRSYEFGYDELLAFKKRLFAAAIETGKPDAPLAVGSWCRFCPALPVCPAQEAHAVELAQAEFSALPAELPPPPERLSEEQILTVLNKGSIVIDWIREVYGYAQTLLEAGEPVPGWKLVPRRATRKWKDPVKATVWCEEHVDEPYQDPKLKSPAQIEKELKAGLPRGKKKQAAVMLEESGHVTKESSGNTIAPTADARPAVSGETAEDEFTALPEGSDS
jgi:hypothetical protein